MDSSDPIDRAQQMQEDMTEAAVKTIRDRAKKSLLPSGFCYFCDEVVKHPLLFCDIGCRDDYEREQKMRRIGGSS